MSEQFLGEIRYFGCNYAPEGWAFCDGTLLRIEDYDALFTLIGTTYGGDGVTTFAVPDLRGAASVHMGTGAEMPERAIGGETALNSAAASPDAARTIGTLVLNPCIAIEGYYPPRE